LTAKASEKNRYVRRRVRPLKTARTPKFQAASARMGHSRR
jgi:hypothetical protein